MKKQFHKIKIAAENLSRSNKLENKNDELNKVEKQVDKYKDVLEKIHKKFSPSAGTDQDREKRIKKVNEYRLAQTLEETAKDLPEELCLFNVMKKCGELEKNIANHILDYEIQTENDVTKRLKAILDNDIQQISNHKRSVNRFVTEYNSVKKAHENAQRSNESQKITSLRQEQEDLELKLEKERDHLAAEMFALIGKDEDMANCIKDFVECQKTYYERILENIQQSLRDINSIVNTCDKKRVFGVPLIEHLSSTNRRIAKVIELSVCCLIDRGLNEEGLLRVGCAGTKLKRLKNAIDAQYVNPPLSAEYQDIHVIGGLLKLYLRELPEPLLTYKLYTDFIQAAQKPTEGERKSAILNAVNQLQKYSPGHYENLRYLTRFLWCLWQRQDVNKMSSQNIAIVMSPNILWPPESSTNPIDYAGQVNSSAAVNTITEMLVSEWEHFFDGDVEFFQTITRDGLFAESGADVSAGFITVEKDGPPYLTEAISQQTNRTHSRSSSHDTSRILINTDTDSMRRGHSNDSLSDTSSATHADSPRLPNRRRHNKPSAPTPPHKTNPPSSSVHIYSVVEPKPSDQSHPATDLAEASVVMQQSMKCDSSSQTPPLTTKSELAQNFIKPDKPPRPAPMECATLNRSTYKNRDRLLSSNKPVALPRTILNAAKSTENLSIQSPDDNERVDIREKPAIPERPATLVRPISYRNEQFQEMMLKTATSDPSPPPPTTTNLKKASSFRGMSTTSMSNNPQQAVVVKSQNSPTSNGNSNGCANNNGNNTPNTTGHNNNHKTTLERAQIYSVEKQQVSIIDVTSSEPTSITTSVTTTANKSPLRIDNPATIGDSAMSQSREFIANESGMQTSLTQVPPSPRGFDPRIKRPQVPAPPPPTNHRKSDGALGDSTHL